MAMTATMPISVPCELCGGRPFTVSVPMHTEPVDGWLRVVVDDEYLRAAVRVHLRQHEN